MSRQSKHLAVLLLIWTTLRGFALNSGAFLSSQPLCHAVNHCPCTGGRDSEPLTYRTTDSHFLCLSAQAGLPMSMLALLLG